MFQLASLFDNISVSESQSWQIFCYAKRSINVFKIFEINNFNYLLRKKKTFEFVAKHIRTGYPLEVARLVEPTLSPNIISEWKLIVTKFRYFNKDDQDFIAKEINMLLIIEPSISLWRVQIVELKTETRRHRKRLCMEYSRNITICNEPAAYPLAGIDDMFAGYKYFSTFDLKSAY